jgi:hypothetical protein
MSEITEQMIIDAQKIVKQMNDMTIKYGQGWLDKLSSFNGSSLLKEYHDKVCDIEKSAQENDNMTHLLYHLMNQHLISFSDMSNKLTAKDKDKNVPADLETSFSLSQNNSKDLVEDNNPGSYAWFSNMKLPDTFAKSEKVQDYYKALSNIFAKDQNVKVRRIHLFYEELKENENFYKPLFTLLFVEKLMRIESKVVFIKNFPHCKKGFFHFDWDLKFKQLGECRAFLLDFALFHNRGKDKSIYGNYTSLFANFCFEKLEDAARNVDERIKQYEGQKVYCLTDYNIFHFLKSYYLSLWNKEKYIKYLEDLSTPNDNTRIFEIVNFYKNNIDVVDFFDFWNKYLRPYGIEHIFDENLFKILYGWDAYKNKISDTTEISELKGTITPDIKKILIKIKDIMDDDKNDVGMWNYVFLKKIFECPDKGFNKYFLR